MISKEKRRIVVGMSGASGLQYGIKILEFLRTFPIETHLIMTKASHQARKYEVDEKLEDILQLADVTHNINDIGCAVASGSFLFEAMIVAPCSMHSLAEIAHGFGSNALTRAADVTLKERRKLVLLVRESPLNAAHLENMLKATNMGAIIAPPVPAFYPKPKDLNEIIEHTAARTLDLLGLHVEINRWPCS